MLRVLRWRGRGRACKKGSACCCWRRVTACSVGGVCCGGFTQRQECAAAGRRAPYRSRECAAPPAHRARAPAAPRAAAPAGTHRATCGHAELHHAACAAPCSAARTQEQRAASAQRAAAPRAWRGGLFAGGALTASRRRSLSSFWSIACLRSRFNSTCGTASRLRGLRCGRGEPSRGADVAGASPAAVQMWQG